jgi:hypothetical protein
VPRHFFEVAVSVQSGGPTADYYTFWVQLRLSPARWPWRSTKAPPRGPLGPPPIALDWPSPIQSSWPPAGLAFASPNNLAGVESLARDLSVAVLAVAGSLLGLLRSLSVDRFGHGVVTLETAIGTGEADLVKLLGLVDDPGHDEQEQVHDGKCLLFVAPEPSAVGTTGPIGSSRRRS